MLENVWSFFPQVQFQYHDPCPNFNRSSVKGPLAKLIRVKDVSTATALEVTAGGKLFNIVVDTEETGKQLLDRGRLKKRYTIIPLNKIAAKSISADVIKKAQSLVGKGKARAALSLVGYEDELRPAMEYVFGSTFVCDSLESAKKVTFDKQVLKRSVSLTGDVFDPSGTLTGGSRPHTASILARLGELCEAEAALQQKETEHRQVQGELESIQSEVAKYRKMSEQRDAKAHEGEMIMTRMQQSTHHQQLTQLQGLKDTIAEQNSILGKAREAEREAKAQLEDVQSKMKDSKSHHERELKAAEAQVAKSRKEAERVTKEAGSQQQAMQTLQLEVEEMEKSLATQQQQIDSCNEKIVEKTKELEALVEADNKAKEALDAAKRALEEEKAILRERNKELQRCEQERKKCEKEKTECALGMKECEHNMAKFRKDTQDAAKRVEAMLAKYDWIATDRQFFGQPNTAYDFAANNIKEVTRRLAKLQEQKDKLSKSVNMRAMNMLGKAEEKYNDLLKKKSIVQKDKAKITELIAELDEKKNETLLGAYERVNKDFGSIFSTLLPGTNAKLSPPEGMDILDGLEVKIAFGSVWKDSLQELSGGQRSLVALSLILALLLFKPAPVYILDEVDAALDLSHTQNIGQMLRTHFSHSQFIVVSLKDGMFNNANVLFKTKFVDGVSTVTRYVNPKLSTGAGSSAGEDPEDGQSLRKRAIAGSHKAKKARVHA